MNCPITHVSGTLQIVEGKRIETHGGPVHQGHAYGNGFYSRVLEDGSTLLCYHTADDITREPAGSTVIPAPAAAEPHPPVAEPEPEAKPVAKGKRGR